LKLYILASGRRLRNLGYTNRHSSTLLGSAHTRRYCTPDSFACLRACTYNTIEDNTLTSTFLCRFHRRTSLNISSCSRNQSTRLVLNTCTARDKSPCNLHRGDVSRGARDRRERIRRESGNHLYLQYQLVIPHLPEVRRSMEIRSRPAPARHHPEAVKRRGSLHAPFPSTRGERMQEHFPIATNFLNRAIVLLSSETLLPYTRRRSRAL
jgi:hypothetical protein